MSISEYPSTNLHVHTPHSFSYFSSIAELADKAAEEGISVLGINDFNTVDGFREFTRLCGEKHIFPSYGIEIMALSRHDQENGALVNDPGNPGRVYLGGKGIPCPPSFDQFALDLLGRIKTESGKRMAETIDKLNDFLAELNAPIFLSFDEIKSKTASGWVRERHIARTLSEKILNSNSPGTLIKKLTGEAVEDINGSSPFLQNLLRSKLLKSGRKAYVRESEGAFADMDEAKRLFLSLGAVPTYPVLADGAGELTDREKDPEILAEWLSELGFYAVEFIPCRNSLAVLTRYAETLHAEGFIVTAGSEHNSPQPLPLKSAARDSLELPLGLQKIFWEGCCVVIAHQEKESDCRGFVDRNGGRTKVPTRELIETGADILRRYERNGC